MLKYQKPGHGLYLMGSNGITYSHHEEEMNNKMKVDKFQLKENDLIYITFDQSAGVLKFFKNSHLPADTVFEMDIITKLNGDIYYGCVYLGQQGDCVELMN